MDVASPQRRRLVVFVGDRAKIASVGMELRRAFDVEWVADAAHLDELKGDVLVLIGEAAWKARSPGLERVPVVAFIAPDVLRRRVAERAVPHEVLIEGQDDHRLPEVLRRLMAPPLLTARGREALGRLPPLVRSSLEFVLEHPAPALVDAVESLAHNTAPFAHTREAFAERFGCSADYLTRLGRRAGLRWSDVHRQALYLRMRHHRLLTGDTWAHTFVRFGIGSPAAGTGFVKRVTRGMIPSTAETVCFEEIRDDFFDLIGVRAEGSSGLDRVG